MPEVSEAPFETFILHASNLAARVNAIFQNTETDVVLAALAKLVSEYLLSLPEKEREHELESWLKLVRNASKLSTRRMRQW